MQLSAGAVLAALFLHNSTLSHILSSYSYGAVFGLVALESLGVPLPGETMLITAALYAGSTGHLDIWLVIATAAGAAIIGDNIGYAIGRWGGFALLRKYGSKLHIDEKRLKVGRYIFKCHGGKVVFFGRFVSILRTYAAFLAGTNRMHWLRFLGFNAAGGIIWATAYGIAYYYFGKGLQSLQTPVDVGIGAVALAIMIGFLVYAKRKENELAERAEQVLPDDELERLEQAS